MAGDLERSVEADRRYLADLDDAELQRVGIERMLRAESRGAFPLDDPAFQRSMREHHHREEPVER